MNDRYKLHQFYQGKKSEIPYIGFQAFEDSVRDVEHLQIVSMAMDFPRGTSAKERQALETEWIGILPSLKKAKSLSIRHRVKQDFFDAICQMKNLENLTFWSSKVEDITALQQLKKLRFLKLWSFTQLKDISPLVKMKSLTHLSIDNCFKVENYEVIGKMVQLVGLELCGDTFAPRKLMLNSLKPFEKLINLKHFDLSSASVRDKQYDSLLKMKSLERLDFLAGMPEQIREKIKRQHPQLKAGFFVDYDFENKKFYDGKDWGINPGVND